MKSVGKMKDVTEREGFVNSSCLRQTLTDELSIVCPSDKFCIPCLAMVLPLTLADSLCSGSWDISQKPGQLRV